MFAELLSLMPNAMEVLSFCPIIALYGSICLRFESDSRMEQSGVFFSHELMSSEPSLTFIAMPWAHTRSPFWMVAPSPFCSTA